MDVTNPGLVDVADEVYGNPDPNGGTAKWAPRESGGLDPVADDGYPAAPSGVPSPIFPTPAEVVVSDPPFLPPPSFTLRPAATEVDVEAQSIGLGSMVPVDPLDPAAGTLFLPPAEYVVVGPNVSFQTNQNELDTVLLTVAAVLDADNLPTPAGPSTTRYLLQLQPPALTTYPVSLLGRQVVFADDSLTVADQGAARIITNYGGNYVVIDRVDNSVDNGDVVQLTTPQVGDTLWLKVGRQGSEDVKIDVSTTITSNASLTPPLPFVPSPPQDDRSSGSVNVTIGPQPGTPYVGAGTPTSAATTLTPVADQSQVVGLPVNVFA